MNYTIGDKIRILRNMKNYSQNGLASKAGIKQETLSYYETNKNTKPMQKEMLKK